MVQSWHNLKSDPSTLLEELRKTMKRAGLGDLRTEILTLGPSSTKKVREVRYDH
jgi:hypothetical protein